MTKQEAIDQAIERVKGEFIPIGEVVGHKSDDRAWRLDDSKDGIAFCSIGEEKKQFPTAEIFSPSRVINAANHFLNLGFWKDGMEGTFVTLSEK